jgi:Spy/CpxP family protein refolding chaperone
MSAKYFFALAAVLCVTPLLAQDAPPANSSPAPMHPARRGGGTPCWQQAGVERSAIENLMSIQRETHSQVENVCSNTSLTPQQKRQQVQEIRQQAHQKIEGLITPDQMKALVACRQARGETTPGVLSGAGGAGGGCGEWQRGGARPGNGAPGAGTQPNNPPAAAPSSPQN